MTTDPRVPGSLIEDAPELVLHETIGKTPAPSVEVSFPRPDAVVVAVRASVDRDTVDELETMLWPQPTSEARLVIVDFTNMYLLNVPDLQLVTHAHMLAHARGGALRVVAANRAIEEALRAAGLHALVECHTTVQRALAPVNPAAGPEPELQQR